MMKALDSAEELDAIMEAAEALVSPRVSKAKPASMSKADAPSQSSELAQAKPAGDAIERPDEPAAIRRNPVDKSLPASTDQSFSFESGPIDTHSSMPKGNLRGKTPYLFFFVAFGIWIVSLLTVYLPISGLVTPVYPLIIDSNIMTVFLGSTAVCFLSSLLIGLSKLGR
jgi:hypothetical protein